MYVNHEKTPKFCKYEKTQQRLDLKALRKFISKSKMNSYGVSLFPSINITENIWYHFHANTEKYLFYFGENVLSMCTFYRHMHQCFYLLLKHSVINKKVSQSNLNIGTCHEAPTSSQSTRSARRPPLAQIRSTTARILLFTFHLVLPRVSRAWITYKRKWVIKKKMLHIR